MRFQTSCCTYLETLGCARTGSAVKCTEFPCVVSHRRLPVFDPFLSSCSLYEYYYTTSVLSQTGGFKTLSSRWMFDFAGCLTGAGWKSNQTKLVGNQSLAPRTSWTKKGQKQIGELNNFYVFNFFSPPFFFLSLSFHWIRAPAFKYSGAAEGSLKSTVPLLVITSPRWNVVPHCLSVLLQNQGGRDEPLLRSSSRSYRRALFLYPGRVLAFFSAGWFICSLRWIRFFSAELLCAQRFLSLYLFSRLVIPVPSVVLLLYTYLSSSFFSGSPL